MKAKRMQPIADNTLKKLRFKILKEAKTIKVIKNPFEPLNSDSSKNVLI